MFVVVLLKLIRFNFRMKAIAPRIGTFGLVRALFENQFRRRPVIRMDKPAVGLHTCGAVAAFFVKSRLVRVKFGLKARSVLTYVIQTYAVLDVITKDLKGRRYRVSMAVRTGHFRDLGVLKCL